MVCGQLVFATPPFSSPQSISDPPNAKHPQEGYWRDPNSGLFPIFRQCADPGACCAEGQCALGEECENNRTGILCGYCEEDFYLWDGACVECEAGISVLPLVAGLLAIWAFTVSTLYKKPSLNGGFKAVIYFVQTLPLTGTRAYVCVCVCVCVWVCVGVGVGVGVSKGGG